jgi:hypothetical protein
LIRRAGGWCFFVAVALGVTVGEAPARTAFPQPADSTSPEFLQAADDVLAQMSEILHLPIREPLKKTLRSKDEIRAYLVREENTDETPEQRYADTKALEAFGLIPEGFPLDSFMLDILTDQIAGLYDPKAKEFYIADWIPIEQQREVMAHELTHALEDQSFHIDTWIKAARPNSDGELARQAVSEGTALAAMLDYALRAQKISVRDLPDVGILIRSGAATEMDKDPKLQRAPPYIRDSLLFPYLAGTDFSQQFLKAHSGWQDLRILFDRPPLSSQQIMHPELYLKGVAPENVSLPVWRGIVPASWKLLDENVVGEFALKEVLKQFTDEKAATNLAGAWAGDRYAVFEDTETKQTSLVFLLNLDNTDDMARFFGRYSELLELKHKERHDLLRRPNFFQFYTDRGGVFLECAETKCLTVERADRTVFDSVSHALKFPPVPAEGLHAKGNFRMGTPSEIARTVDARHRAYGGIGQGN